MSHWQENPSASDIFALLDLEDKFYSLGILVFKAPFSLRQKQHQNIKSFLLLAGVIKIQNWEAGEKNLACASKG